MQVKSTQQTVIVLPAEYFVSIKISFSFHNSPFFLNIAPLERVCKSKKHYGITRESDHKKIWLFFYFFPWFFQCFAVRYEKKWVSGDPKKLSRLLEFFYDCRVIAYGFGSRYPHRSPTTPTPVALSQPHTAHQDAQMVNCPPTRQKCLKTALDASWKTVFGSGQTPWGIDKTWFSPPDFTMSISCFFRTLTGFSQKFLEK